MYKFVCAESEDHVKKVNPTPEMVIDMLTAFKHMDIGVSLSPEQLERAKSKDISINERHDFLHMLLDDMIVAFEQGNKELNCPTMTTIMEEVKMKQKECRGDHS